MPSARYSSTESPLTFRKGITATVGVSERPAEMDRCQRAPSDAATANIAATSMA